IGREHRDGSRDVPAVQGGSGEGDVVPNPADGGGLAEVGREHAQEVADGVLPGVEVREGLGQLQRDEVGIAVAVQGVDDGEGREIAGQDVDLGVTEDRRGSGDRVTLHANASVRRVAADAPPREVSRLKPRVDEVRVGPTAQARDQREGGQDGYRTYAS